MKKLLSVSLLFLFLSVGLSLSAQDGDLMTVDETFHLIDRLEVRGALGKMPVHSFSRTFGREEISEIFRSVHTDSSLAFGNRMNRWLRNARRLYDDGFHDSLLRADTASARKFFLFQNRRDAVQYRLPGFEMVLNPIIYAGYGRESVTDLPQQSFYRNGKGASLRLKVSNRIGLFSDITDVQTVYPEFIRTEQQRYLGALPSENTFKPFGQRGYDFLNVRAGLSYTPTKYLKIRLGRDRAFWGNGYQSLILSDHATEHFFLDLHLKAGKFGYRCRYTRMSDYITAKADILGQFPEKYGAFHEISFFPDRRLGITLFESVMYAPLLPGGRRGIELQYFNPLIFYRSVEQALGSPDNTFLGLNIKANVLRRFQLYGQLVIDDYNFSERKNGPGWWGNKWAAQAGLKAFDLFNLETLDLQAEINLARPYTYAHFNPSANYTHLGQALAHPMGANFREVVFIVRYRPAARLSTVLTAVYLQKGEDPPAGLNAGGNIFRTNLTHDNGKTNPNYDNEILQGGLRTDIRVNVRLSWQPFITPLFAEIEAFFRSTRTDTDRTDLGGMVQIRWFFGGRSVRF